MRHVNQSMFYYTVLADGEIVFYECFSATEAAKMAEQDGYKVVLVLNVDTDSDDTDEFIVRKLLARKKLNRNVNS